MTSSAHGLDSHCHTHAYLPAGHEARERRATAAVLLTLAMMAAEVAAGLAFGSLALLADGVHMATHAGALGIAALAYRYARTRLGDPRFTFGTGKVGELAGFASALLLGVVALGIAWESVARLLAPAPIAYGEATLVAALGLGVNLLTAAILGGGHGHGHDHDHPHAHAHAHGEHDSNFRSAYFHVLADAITSVLAILGLLAGRFLGWGWADAAVGLVGAAVILAWSWSLVGATARVLVDATDPALVERVRRAIETDGDAKVSDLHVWQVGPGAQAAIVHLVAARPLEVEAYHSRLDGLEGLRHVSIEARRCEVGH